MVIGVKVLVLLVEEELRAGREVFFEGGTLEQFIQALARDYQMFKVELTRDNAEGTLLPHIRVAVNKNPAVNTKMVLDPGSEVVFYPVMAGG